MIVWGKYRQYPRYQTPDSVIAWSSTGMPATTTLRNPWLVYGGAAPNRADVFVWNRGLLSHRHTRVYVFVR